MRNPAACKGSCGRWELIQTRLRPERRQLCRLELRLPQVEHNMIQSRPRSPKPTRLVSNSVLGKPGRPRRAAVRMDRTGSGCLDLAEILCRGWVSAATLAREPMVRAPSCLLLLD